MAALFGTVLFVELVVVAVSYQFLIDLDCGDFGSPQACLAIRDGLGRLLSLAMLVGLLMTARRQLFGFLDAGPAQNGGLSPGTALGVMLAGLAVMLLPMMQRDLTASLAPLALGLGLGAALSVGGAVLGTAPLASWLSILRRGGPWLWLGLGLALFSPELTALLNGAWGWRPLTAVTFDMVLGVLALLPGELTFEPGPMIIGFDDFFVRVGDACSGLQGFALITLVTTAFIAFERHRLRLPLALILLPLGLLASFALNVVRIAVLIWIGARISPDLAVNAFHSYAGWLLFTLLSIGLIGLAHLTPVLWRTEAAATSTRPVAAFRRDPVSAMLVPLVVLLLSGLVASTFFMTPESAYPYRVPAMFAGAALFCPVWARLDWRTDMVAPLVGVGVGILWIAVSPALGGPVDAAPFAGMGLAAAAIWIALRFVGTVLLVPLIEEAAFRGYLLGHLLKLPGPAGRVAAAILSSAAFAFLHASGPAAFVAGLAFAAVYLRRGRLADAVWSHAAANLAVFAAAAASGNWALI
ncbi:exosortase E/protease, VPEID-CTERM system [Paracoccus sp. S-4012]|uniref:exosortase E/protease, VPEID-CTERM system n=1 Tax=Paracoccus sp. S-4012 TaxID=2665648 RepID=UPI0018A1E8D8